MNTNARIITTSSGKAGGKNNYIKGRDKGGDLHEINVLIDNGFSKDRVRLNEIQKKERRQLQKDLHIYTKRMEKAIENGKDKVAENNRKKVDKIQAKLDKPFVKDHEREIIDLTLTLVNGRQAKDLTPEHKHQYNQMVKEFIGQEFKDLHTVTLATHYDQRSPHAHALLQCVDQTWSDYLRSRYEVEDTREAYRQIQHNFHDFVESKGQKLDELQRGRKYVGLGEYKEKGNYFVEQPVDTVQDGSEPLAAQPLSFEDPEQIKRVEQFMEDHKDLPLEEVFELWDKQLEEEQETAQNELESQNTSNDTPEEGKTLKNDSKQDLDTDKSTGSKKRRNR